MLDSLEDTITEQSKSLFDRLKTYEGIYTPDIGLERPEGGQIFDLKVESGDIKMYGFYHGASYDNVVALAMQDVLLRLFINPDSSIFNDTFGNGLLSQSISNLTGEILEALIQIVLSDSPFIGSIGSIFSSQPVSGEIDLSFSAKTITNDQLSFDEVINYG